jgi:hypothetical protein
MLIGHYAASLTLKRLEKNASLGLLFLGAQLVDILYFSFVLLGIERIRIVENYTASTHFMLEFFPYTHSLVASFLWAGAVYLLFRLLPSRKDVNKNRIAIVMALAVVSHWFFDLIVHTPDLPLLGDNSLKLGFGLWNNAVASFSLEGLLVLVSLWFYLRGTEGESFAGKYGMIIVAVFMMFFNFTNTFGPLLPGGTFSLVIFGLVSYLGFAGVAFWLDRKRTPLAR